MLLLAKSDVRLSRIGYNFWLTSKVNVWPDEAKLLAIYLSANPHGNTLGCFVLPKLYACSDLDWKMEVFETTLSFLVDEGFAHFDPSSNLVLLKNYLKQNPIENPNQTQAAIKALHDIPASPLLSELRNIVASQRRDCLSDLLRAIDERLPEGGVLPAEPYKTKPKRKPVSNKTRFEVLRRDGFKCRYCGRSAPEVILNVDHIVPVEQGGTNDIGNLVTACFECNNGKSARPVLMSGGDVVAQSA